MNRKNMTYAWDSNGDRREVEIDALAGSSSLHCLVGEFLSLLEKEEVSDSGTVFRPNKISSWRVFDSQRILELLEAMKESISNDK